MTPRVFYYSIQSVRMSLEGARKFREDMRKQHFLPENRFKVVKEISEDGIFYRGICKIWESELPRFRFRKLRNHIKSLQNQTRKVLEWRKLTGRAVRC